MKKLVLKTLSGLLLGTACAAAWPQNVRLMPMGDSITAGIGTPVGNGYRLPLWNLLVGEISGHLNFVGSRHDYGNMSDNDNEGHSGWKIKDIAGIATGVVQQYRPNVVTLHLGTNDMNQNDQVATAPERLGALVDQIFTAAPDATLLVSTIITASNQDTAARIAAYNPSVRDLVQVRANAGRHIALVDMSGVTTGDLSDGLHPNDNGFQKMATAWNEGFKRVQLLGWIKDPVPLAQELMGSQSKRCLDVSGASQADGSKPIIWDCSGAPNQKWTARPNGTLEVYGNKCLDVLSHATAPGSAVGIWGCNGGRNQQWRLNPNGTVVGVESGLCLDVSGNATAGGSPVSVWTCHGGANQQWEMR